MSLSITTDVFCDGEDCSQWTSGATGPTTDAKVARKEARRMGWKITKGRDLCPNCKRKEQADG